MSEQKLHDRESARNILQKRKISPASYNARLLKAAYEGDVELLKLLIAAGADVNTSEDGTLTPLIIAASEGYAACVEQLLESDAIDVNFADDCGKTALHHAAEEGYADCVKLLLEDPDTEVDPNADYDSTPLSGAEKKHHADCVRLLRAAGYTQVAPYVILPPVPEGTFEDKVFEGKNVVKNYLYKWIALASFVAASVGVIFALLGFDMYSKSAELKNSGISTQGLVIELYNKGQYTCNPTVRFYDTQGQQHEARSISGVADYDQYKMHDTVQILYSPQDPQTMEIVHTAGYAHYFILMAGGVVECVVFLVFGVLMWKKRRKY